MADAARDEPDEHLARLRLGEVELLHLERRAEPLQHRGADLHRRRAPARRSRARGASCRRTASSTSGRSGRARGGLPLGQLVDVPVGIGERERPGDEIRAVLANLDRDLVHGADSNYTRRVRICLVTPFAWSQPHDVNEHVAGIAKELRALGHTVTVLAPSGAHRRPDRRASCARARRGRRRDRDRRRRCPISRRSSLGVPVGVRANLHLALQQGRFDVVHGFEPGLPSISYLALRDSEALGVATLLLARAARLPAAARAAREAARAGSTRCSRPPRRRPRPRPSASPATTGSSRPASTPSSSARPRSGS